MPKKYIFLSLGFLLKIQSACTHTHTHRYVQTCTHIYNPKAHEELTRGNDIIIDASTLSQTHGTLLSPSGADEALLGKQSIFTRLTLDSRVYGKRAPW